MNTSTSRARARRKNGEAREGGGGGGVGEKERERGPRGVKGVYEGTRHREAYMRRGGWGERTGRGSVAPRSHAFRSVMAAAGRSDAPRPSSSCAHAHTAAVGPGRPAGLVALAERGEKERSRKTERKRCAFFSVCVYARARARAVFIGYSGTRVP